MFFCFFVSLGDKQWTMNVSRFPDHLWVHGFPLKLPFLYQIGYPAVLQVRPSPLECCLGHQLENILQVGNQHSSNYFFSIGKGNNLRNKA